MRPDCLKFLGEKPKGYLWEWRKYYPCCRSERSMTSFLLDVFFMFENFARIKFPRVSQVFQEGSGKKTPRSEMKCLCYLNLIL